MNELIKTLERIAYATEKISLRLQALSDQQEIANDTLHDVVLKLNTLTRQNASRGAIRFDDEQLNKLEDIANIFKK